MFLQPQHDLVNGSDYTFRFRLPSIFVFQNLAAKLAATNLGIGGIRMSHSYFDRDVSVQFTWFGSDGYKVSALAASMSSVLDSCARERGRRTQRHFPCPAEDAMISTMALVPQVVRAVSLPVIAAGGIMTGQVIRAAAESGRRRRATGHGFSCLS